MRWTLVGFDDRTVSVTVITTAGSKAGQIRYEFEADAHVTRTPTP